MQVLQTPGENLCQPPVDRPQPGNPADERELVPTPNISYIDRLALVRDITAGKLSGLGIPGYASSKIQVLAVASFANGYHALFLAGALFMFLATILTWPLVGPADTQPLSAPSPKHDELV
jgi:hypothetical protein